MRASSPPSGASGARGLRGFQRELHFLPSWWGQGRLGNVRAGRVSWEHSTALRLGSHRGDVPPATSLGWRRERTRDHARGVAAPGGHWRCTASRVLGLRACRARPRKEPVQPCEPSWSWRPAGLSASFSGHVRLRTVASMLLCLFPNLTLGSGTLREDSGGEEI